MNRRMNLGTPASQAAVMECGKSSVVLNETKPIIPADPPLLGGSKGSKKGNDWSRIGRDMPFVSVGGWTG